ncbi:MAG: GNAT family N-acetyltransferase [Clostridia bacterium]|nr:GNAT family N-acetyltransferase [Clostridia bacterium]
MENQANEKKIELRKAETPSKYLTRIPKVDMESDFYEEVEKNSEELFEIVADGEVIGLAYVEDEEDAYIYIYIFAEHRGKGYSYPAALAAERSIKTVPPKSIHTGYDANNAIAKRLAEKCGYAPKYASALMKYGGEKFDEDELPIRHYREEDFDEAYTLTDEAFHKMRLETGQFPDSKQTPPTEKTRENWSKAAEDSFIYVVDGEMVGRARLSGRELANVAIKIARQGEGFGRKFVKYLTNRLIEKGLGEPALWCIVGNDKARKLYESLGYRETDRAEYSAKRIVD